MTAEIVAIGTELLLGQIVDTNSAELGRALAPLGIAHMHRQTVGDNLERLIEALKVALGRADIVFTIGGLGPTEDDLTRQGIAAALDDVLVHDDRLERDLRELWKKRNIPWADSQLRQAQRPTCAEPIANPNGTAPGLVCRKGGKVLVAMPGPSGEFVPMLEGPVRAILAGLGEGTVIYSRELKVTGMGETIVEKRLGELVHSQNPTVAPYAKPGEVHLRITAKASSLAEAEDLIRPFEAEVRELLGDAVFGVNGDTLESVVVGMLVRRGETLAVAESCTGGELGGRITNVPGASEAFLGGVIAYSNAVKAAHLGVRQATLDKDGAVSEACAAQMAQGVRERFGATYGISVTGIAGPGGGTPGKPVGFVFLGIATPEGVVVERRQYIGVRATVRRRSTQDALTMLRAAIAKRG